MPTEYRVEGGALVQTVRPGPNTAYPVVADPAWFIPLAIVAGRLLLSTGVKSISKHAAPRMAQRGISPQTRTDQPLVIHDDDPNHLCSPSPRTPQVPVHHKSTKGTTITKTPARGVIVATGGRRPA
ncbi:hypothetical protein [Streptomyces sp. NPDC088755]|uniref:hypothetical protein n=1 Tax=Streptomyces sp. NPDC088755 TaxID=3365888 RepID=UPI0038292697